MPPTCPLLAVAGDDTLLCHPCLLHAHPGSGQAGVDLEGTHVRAATLLPHSVQIRVGGVPFICNPAEKSALRFYKASCQGK